MVTGSRDWTNKEAIRQGLTRAVEGHQGPHTLVHGAARGADTLAADAAYEMGWQLEAFPADWSQGRGAGLMRNQAMIDTEPDVVVAFPLPDSRGTPHAMGLARQAGIDLIVCTSELPDASALDDL